MKKIILSIISVLVIGGAIFYGTTLLQSSHPAVHSTKIENTTTQLHALNDLGFKNCDNFNLGDQYDLAMNPDKVKFYQEKYGLHYLSEEGLAIRLKELELVKGDPSTFIAKIPSGAIDEMSKNLAAITIPDEKTVYYFTGADCVACEPWGWVSASEIKPEVRAELIQNPGAGTWLGYALYNDRYSKNFEKALMLYASPTYSILKHITKIMVCAPKEDFNMDGNTIIDNTVVKKPVDPMVIAVMLDGYVVVAHW